MAKILLKKNNIRKNYAKIDLRSSMCIRLLYQEVGVTVAYIYRRFPQFAKRSIYRHAAATTTSTVNGPHKNKGRPKRLCSRDERLIIRTLKKLRKEREAFSAKRIREEAQLHHVSLKTIYRYWEKTITITDNRERRDSFRQKIKICKKGKKFPE